MSLLDKDAMQESLNKYVQRTDNNPERIERFKYFYQLAREKGVVSFRYARIAEEYTDDYFADTGIPQSEKDWYYNRGIPTFKTGWYGLNKQNYNDYISDFDFYSPSNYLNKSQVIKWFDYKLTTYYILSPFREYMPHHFFFLNNGELAPIGSTPNKYSTIEDALSIIQNGPVALKACSGGHGKGFYKIETKDGQYKINNIASEEKDVRALLLSLDDYLFTEYSTPHKAFRHACGENSYAVLRVVSVFDKDGGPQITGIMIRLGTSGTGIVTDYDGCINCGVDLQTGQLFNPLMRTGDSEGIIKRIPIKNHPDTGVDMETIIVPEFAKLKAMVKRIAAHLAVTPYLVIDIIPTDMGLDILEINSHGQVRIVEPFSPFRKNKYNLRVFQTKDW